MCPKKLATLPFVYLSANMDTIFCAIKIVLRLGFFDKVVGKLARFQISERTWNCQAGTWPHKVKSRNYYSETGLCWYCKLSSATTTQLTAKNKNFSFFD